MKSVGKTDLGLVRKNNQDKYLCINDLNGFYIFAVADGLGGHNAGEVASSYTVEKLTAFFREELTQNLFKQSDQVIEKIVAINKEIFALSNASSNLSGMGTTLTLAVADEKKVILFHVGDSRAYLINNQISQLTKDHSLVQFMLDHGQITEEEAYDHPQKNIITRALGTDDEIEVDVVQYGLNEKDRILLCSDGLTNCVKDADIMTIVQKNTIQSAVSKLIDRAKKNGGNDNITVVICEN